MAARVATLPENQRLSNVFKAMKEHPGVSPQISRKRPPGPFPPSSTRPADPPPKHLLRLFLASKVIFNF